MKKLFYTLWTFLVLNSACSGNRDVSDVVFTSIQPEGADNLNSFPAKIFGNYEALKDSSILRITSHGLYQTFTTLNKTHIKDLDTSFHLIGDTLLEASSKNYSIPVKRVGDSLFHQTSNVDTLFQLNGKNVLRKLKDELFLNSQTDQGWVVRKLKREKHFVTLSYIDSTDLAHLKTLAFAEMDSIPFKFSINAQSFRDFVHRNGFHDVDTFTLILPASKKCPSLHQ